MKETNDCIYRKAALDCIREYIDEYSEVDSDGLHNLKWCAMKEAEMVLTDLPAADVRPERYARKVKFFNDPWALKKFTTCTACDGKVGPRDKYCKHCGAKFEEVTDD